MTLLLLGLVIFFAAHIFATMRDARANLIAKIGEKPYKGLYSIVALIALILIIIGWGARPFIPVWDPPVWTRHLAAFLMIPAMILLASSFLPSGRIAAAAKHPMLAAVKIWAFAHLLANGDLASLLLFGAFLAFAVYDRIQIKTREGVSLPQPGPMTNDALAVAGGLVFYAAFVLALHPLLIGVPVFL